MQLLREKIQGQAYAIVRTQWMGLMLLTLLSLFLGLKIAFSFLMGGLSGLVPNFILVAWVFRRVRSQEMSQFVSRFALGELFKLSLSTFFLLLVVKYLPISLSSTLAGFMGVIVLFWISGMIHLSNRHQSIKLTASESSEDSVRGTV